MEDYTLAGRRVMHVFHIGLETGKEIVVGQRKGADLHPKTVMDAHALPFKDHYSS
jgi:hypothetical protein